ncbi:helix-turn-helix transcriptional regulator [Fuchsiella alkaliacetigena]|uniref:helix-turn-helix transcriptional regulator n=1 Tax=Fuchsiella alkaliacetigena TaxID=957042 RepID=UPI00200A44BF|nr:helix-turn-helix transcriptional regulator [Fuchsiella alkaliacetigena]MCK8825364.1 helix-turn-helix transcriptional regulator [Fuchsiella alkaliacetigena]
MKNKLSELRENKDLTQEQLAEKLDISASAIGMYEIGKRFPKLQTAKKIADFFGVSIEEVFF